MKNKKKILRYTLLIVIIGFIIWGVYFLKSTWNWVQPHRTLERIGLVKNNINVKIDSTIDKENFYIYWIGSLYDNKRENDTLLIYHKRIINKIPDAYLKNCFLLEHNGLKYNKIGVLKMKAWYKHDYNIKVHLKEECLVIDWNITNIYDEEYKGIDTICNTKVILNNN